MSWEESQRAFGDAAQWFVRTAALVGDRWAAPGLGEWDVRALVGEVSGVIVVSALNHTTRSAAQDFRKQLQLLEGNSLGVVANLAPTPRNGYYY